MSRSAPARVQVELIPAELREWHQWVCWRWEKRKDKNGNDTWTKPPMQPNGEYANSTNPETWTSFDNALAALQAGRGLAGIGFVFADDPYSGIDIDDCRNSQNGIIQPWARLIIERLNSYTEISPSGTGVKTWIRAKLSAGGRHRNRRAYEGGEIEIYSRGRYFTVTSQHLTGTPNTIESRQRELDQLHEELFPVSVPPGNGRPHPNGSRPDSLSDRELIDKAKGAANGAKFTSLWNGDITGYPSQSEADLALCTMLAFWTDNSSSRIDALFRQSGLFREDSKWDKRADYRERTITAAIARTYETYKPRERADGNGKRPTILTEEQAEREAIQQEDEFTFIVPARQFLSIIDPPICYLIPELLPDRTMALDHGWPRSLKSWAAVEKGIALATGTPAFAMERFRVETPVHVLYLSQEDAESIVRMRVKALLKARKIEQYPETLSFSVFKGIDLDSTEWQDLLCRGIQKNGIRLVIFDPIRRFTSEADRGPHEVGRITQYLRARIINVEGSGSDIVHHDTKPPADGKDDRPRPQRVSGGDWYSSCECPISYERISDTSSLVVPEGYKLSKDPESFQIRLDTDDERNPTRASLIGETVDATDAADLTLHHQIREYVIANPGKAGSAIAKAIHRNKDDVIKALNNSPDFDSVKHRNAHLWHFRGNP